jgi:hypothetical protein
MHYLHALNGGSYLLNQLTPSSSVASLPPKVNGADHAQQLATYA